VSLHEIVEQCSTCNFSNFVERLKGDIIKNFTCNFSNFVEILKGDIIKKHVQMLLASPQEFWDRH
jgi:hypothetical protein